MIQAPHQEDRSSACPDYRVLVDFALGKLSLPDAQTIADHVGSCPTCGDTLSHLDLSADPLLATVHAAAQAEPFSESDRRNVIQRVATLLDNPAEIAIARVTAAVAGVSGEAVPELPRLDCYQLLERLGEGGMGTVFKARHIHLNKIVAIKILTLGRLRGEQAIARFRREMRTIGQLEHANIVGAHDAGESDGVHFLVMDYIDGLDLRILARRVGPLPVAEACELIRQAACGLQHVHENGLVHRDIKPSNLMLSRSGQVRLLDLGLALLQSEQPPGGELTDSSFTVGTADYIAPEQIDNSHDVDGRTDIYSLACTLYTLLVGHAPFSSPAFNTKVKKLMAHVSCPVPSICGLRPDVPAELVELLERMLAKKPVDRCATAAEVARALGPFSEGANLLDLLSSALNGKVVATAPVSGICSSPFVSGPIAGFSKAPAAPAHQRPLDMYRWVATAVAAALILCVGGMIYWKIGNGTQQKKEVPAVAHVGVVDQLAPPKPLTAPFSANAARAGQAAWAEYLGIAMERKNPLGMSFVLIPPGEVLMGSTPEQSAVGVKMAEDAKLLLTDRTWTHLKEEGPQHRVTLTKAYWLGMVEVTVGQFKKFTDATQYVTDAEQFGFGSSSAKRPDEKVTLKMKKATWRTPGYAITDDLPVTQVSWNDALQFCNWLSREEKLGPCYRQDAKASWSSLASGTGYRLPTEAEWEYACRAGTTTQFSFGDDPALLDSYGWFNNNSGDRPHAIGSKVANAFGLFDMHGNAFEWCHDCYAADYYSNSPSADPFGPPSGSVRACRGGSWHSNLVRCRSAYRYSYLSVGRYPDFGFRVMRVSKDR